MSEIRNIITDQIQRHVAMTDTHRAWLANDIATRVEAEVARLHQIEKEEYETRGAIQRHINRAELPLDIPATNDQPEMVGAIVDELHKTQAALTRFADAECDREGPKVDDTARLNWLELTASGLNWQLHNTGCITRASIDAALAEAEAEEAKDTANEP